MFFDSHCHLTDEKLASQFDAVLARMKSASVNAFINIGSDIASSQAALDQCRKAREHGFVCGASAGFHPHQANEFTEDCIKVLLALWNDPLCVAAGEIGLDYFYDENHPDFPCASREIQRKVLLTQLQLAAENQMPVIIHNREADEDLLNAISQFPDLRGVFHCFNSSWEVAEKVLSHGFYLGFTGMVTFKNAHSVREVARQCPLDRLLIETDSPYLAPVPHRGKTNEPAFVPRVAQVIAEGGNISVEKVAKTSFANARRLFDLR
jgi:TatD DNase family protein